MSFASVAAFAAVVIVYSERLSHSQHINAIFFKLFYPSFQPGIYISESFTQFTVNARRVINRKCTSKALMAWLRCLLSGFVLLCWIANA